MGNESKINHEEVKATTKANKGDPLRWQNHINDVANQIEAGKGNHTRRVDQLFED